MHYGAAYLIGQLGGTADSRTAPTFTLSGSQAETLGKALGNDARGCYFSACTSLVDAICGLQNGLYTWATVKCYYSVFYALHSLLAVDGHCLFYLKKPSGKIGTPFWITSRSGSSPAKAGKSSGTHQIVLSRFKVEYPNHRLGSQPIMAQSALDWLMERRVESNYTTPRFLEPDVPKHFRKVEEIGIRKALGIYVGDDRDLYLFDSDHAMLAYPLRALMDVGGYLQNQLNWVIEEDAASFLGSKCRDAAGAITPLTNFFDTLAHLPV